MTIGGVRGVMDIVAGNGHGDGSSNPGRVCISYDTNTLGKVIDSIILPSSLVKKLGRLFLSWIDN